jgi:hypothetical protein
MVRKTVKKFVIQWDLEAEFNALLRRPVAQYMKDEEEKSCLWAAYEVFLEPYEV